MPKHHREDRKSGNQTRAAWLLPVKKGVMGWLCLAVSMMILGAAGEQVWAQNTSVQLVKVAETATHIEYRISNPGLEILPPFELPAAVSQGRADIQILQQQVRSISTPIDSVQAKAWALKSTQVPVVETGFIGSFRGQDIASVVLHMARFSPNSSNPPNPPNSSNTARGSDALTRGATQTEVTRELHIRVGKTAMSPDIDRWGRPQRAQQPQRTQQSQRAQQSQLSQQAQSWENNAANAGQIGAKWKQQDSTPLASGEWYKIPVSREGIHGLSADYLEELGLDVSRVDPRNLQIWGTDGKVLPERNNSARPDFAQIPVLVQGEADGAFDANDVLLFYGISPDQEFRNLGEFSHSIHPYSDSTFVFLTVGEQPGLRMKSETDFCAPCANQVRTWSPYSADSATGL